MIIIEILASLGVIVSFLLISFKEKLGFLIGILAQTLWILYGIYYHQWAFTIMSIFLFGVCVWGYINWSK